MTPGISVCKGKKKKGARKTGQCSEITSHSFWAFIITFFLIAYRNYKDFVRNHEQNVKGFAGKCGTCISVVEREVSITIAVS